MATWPAGLSSDKTIASPLPSLILTACTLTVLLPSKMHASARAHANSFVNYGLLVNGASDKFLRRTVFSVPRHPMDAVTARAMMVRHQRAVPMIVKWSACRG